MPIEESLILRLEQLARLSLTDTERKELLPALSDMIAMIDTLQELDFSAAPIPEELPGLSVSIRKDQTQPPLSSATALQQAPQSDGTYFLVPRVLGTEQAQPPDE